MLAELAALGPSPADACQPGGVEAAELLGQVRDLTAFADQVTGALARLAAALDACGGVAEAGYSSTAGFLRHGCGRSPGRAGELVAAGRALRRLAATGKALMAGELSFDAAHVICRTAGQIEDDATALVMEELLLAAARNQRPDLAHRAAQHPGPDGEAPADGEASPGEQTAPGQDAAPDGEAPPDQDAAPGGQAPSGEQPVPGAVGPLGRWGIPGLDPGALRRLGRNSSTAPTPMPSRSGNGNDSSAGTCRSGSPSTTPAPFPVRAGTPCPGRSSRPPCTRSARRAAPKTPGPRPSAGWTA